MKLTVTTWNMDHWKRTPAERAQAWEILKASGCDVALLQETVPARDLPRQDIVWREIGRERRFGSAVVSLKGWPTEELATAKSCYSYLAYGLYGTFPGSVAIARMRPPGVAPITFVSIYTVIDGAYAVTTLLRQIADLMPLFDSVHGERVIVGGDLNVSTQASGVELTRARAAFGALESLGLVDLFRHVSDRPSPMPAGTCDCASNGCYHVGTHRNAARGADRGIHLDYLFATEPLASRCKSLRLRDDDAVWSVSDHCPVEIDLDVEEAVEPTAWDEQYVADVADTMRAVLAETRDWRGWTPGQASPVVRTDRSLRTWVAAFWEGTLSDGRPAQVELGIWRDPRKTGMPLCVHAGLVGKPMTVKLAGLRVAPPAGEKVVALKHADYVVIPLAERQLPQVEAGRAIAALLDGLRAS